MSVLFQESLQVILLLSGVPLLTAAATGLCVSLLQAVTQIQEQTITYAVKFLTLIVVLLIFAEWGTALINEFTVRILGSIGAVSV